MIILYIVARFISQQRQPAVEVARECAGTDHTEILAFG